MPNLLTQLRRMASLDPAPVTLVVRRREPVPLAQVTAAALADLWWPIFAHHLGDSVVCAPVFTGVSTKPQVVSGWVQEVSAHGFVLAWSPTRASKLAADRAILRVFLSWADLWAGPHRVQVLGGDLHPYVQAALEHLRSA